MPAANFKPGMEGMDASCEYGQAAADEQKCYVPCHGVGENVCECVSQERARNAMTALKNGLMTAGGAVLPLVVLGWKETRHQADQALNDHIRSCLFEPPLQVVLAPFGGGRRGCSLSPTAWCK